MCSSTSWDFTYEHSYFLSHHPRMLGELTGKDVTTIYVSCIEVSVLVERLGIVGCWWMFNVPFRESRTDGVNNSNEKTHFKAEWF